MSGIASKKVIASRANTFRAQDLGRGASVFIVDAYSLVTVGPKVIITAGAIASGAQDLNIRASS